MDVAKNLSKSLAERVVIAKVRPSLFTAFASNLIITYRLTEYYGT